MKRLFIVLLHTKYSVSLTLEILNEKFLSVPHIPNYSGQAFKSNAPINVMPAGGGGGGGGEAGHRVGI